jgi:hypothetical protein
VSTTSTPARVGAREIRELLAWCRRLSVVGPTTDPAERAAYLAAKTDLLTRITEDPDPRHHDGDHDGRDQEQR